jgi:hypothetical protein
VSILLFHSPTPASVSFAQKLRQLGDIAFCEWAFITVAPLIYIKDAP